ncbi:hypothetical protein CDL15_Pgr005823 [Punica granatum]|uniref:Glycoside hydrolase family 3 C-terminal domain-containing protein n=1 Tax=Punica granatum TaxID=22663 RepID=A0A218WG30_PUNGR|nr:hypothetical protein CDL15_Pgr005823 [Punica granatum]
MPSYKIPCFLDISFQSEIRNPSRAKLVHFASPPTRFGLRFGRLVEDIRGRVDLRCSIAGQKVEGEAETGRTSLLRSCSPFSQVLGPRDVVKFQDDLMSLVEAGEVPISRINDAVERILRVKFAAGIFEHPFSDRSLLDLVGCKLHREISREAVRKSLVLLKNGKDPEKPLLPLDKNARKILVAGTHADDLGYQCGAWTVRWIGDSGRTTIGTTILDAIKQTVGPESEVIFEQCPLVDTLSAHDFAFAIVAVGETPYAEYISSKTELVIPSDLADMICSVADRVPTLLALITGRPIELKPEMLEKIDALVAAWLPQTEGNGITDVVFGDYDFMGRLPVSWFKRLDQLPMDPGAALYDPLFPFGFGLTYNAKMKTNSI